MKTKKIKLMRNVTESVIVTVDDTGNEDEMIDLAWELSDDMRWSLERTEYRDNGELYEDAEDE